MLEKKVADLESKVEALMDRPAHVSEEPRTVTLTEHTQRESAYQARVPLKQTPVLMRQL